jgi:D-3-phosphoglycerate dehydrogenase
MGRPDVIILNAEAKAYSPDANAIVNSLGELRNADLDRAGLISSLADVDVLIVRLGNRIDSEVMDCAPRLRVIESATTGLDHIDLQAAAAHGISVLSLRGESEFLAEISATAEHTWTLLLALIRRLPEAYESVRRDRWDRDCFRGRELRGRRLGLLGLGRLGTKVGHYGLAFDMAVTAFDPNRRDWPDGLRRALDSDEVLAHSDVLSLHVPLNDETNGMIGARELALLPAGSVLINTSRGELIDERALVEALSQRHLAGAALDVIPRELDHKTGARRSPLVEWAKQHPDRLLITPHVGGATVESMAKTETFMAKKLAVFLAGIGTASATISRQS